METPTGSPSAPAPNSSGTVAAPSNEVARGAPEPPPGLKRLPPSQIERALRLSTIEGALSNIHLSITTSAFSTGFALLLGATPFELGVMGALPFVSQLFQFVGAYLVERTGTRRSLAAVTAGISRALWGLMALLPFLPALQGVDVWIFLGLLALSQALIGIAGNAWTSWMTDLVPARRRGRYFGVRNTIASVTAMISTWVAGRLLDHYRLLGDDATGYLLIMGIAVVTAIAGVVVLNRQPEPPMRKAERIDVGQMFSAPLRNRPFRTFSLIALAWAVVTGIAAPFFNAFGLQTLQLDFAQLALFGIGTSIVSMVCQPWIGRLQDRYGDRTVMIWCTFGVTMLPWGWVASTPTFLIPLWITSLLAGLFWPGITQGWLNMLMERAPADGRGAYLAAFNALSGVGTISAGLLGGVLAQSLGPTLVISLGPMILTQYSILFAFSSLGRWVVAVVVWKLL